MTNQEFFKDAPIIKLDGARPRSKHFVYGGIPMQIVAYLGEVLGKSRAQKQIMLLLLSFPDIDSTKERAYKDAITKFGMSKQEAEIYRSNTQPFKVSAALMAHLTGQDMNNYIKARKKLFDEHPEWISMGKIRGSKSNVIVIHIDKLYNDAVQFCEAKGYFVSAEAPINDFNLDDIQYN